MKKLSVNQIADAAALAATANYTFTADSHQVVSVQAVYTSTTASFTLALQHSNDGATWVDFASATAISNASGNVMWNVVGTKDSLFWRVNATRTSGTLTTLKAYLAYQPR
jgi:hypothetical protein